MQFLFNTVCLYLMSGFFGSVVREYFSKPAFFPFHDFPFSPPPFLFYFHYIDREALNASGLKYNPTL